MPCISNNNGNSNNMMLTNLEMMLHVCFGVMNMLQCNNMEPIMGQTIQVYVYSIIGDVCYWKGVVYSPNDAILLCYFIASTSPRYATIIC